MNTNQVIATYLSIWNETDPKRRRAAIDALYTEDCHYADPIAVVNGRDALDGLIGGVQRQFPGFTFTLAGRVDDHHAQARFTWHAAPRGAAEPAVIGFDVVVLDGERIRSVYGFLDKVPGE
jgi:hypothetical protein